jgi:hypothetical protein
MSRLAMFFLMAAVGAALTACGSSDASSASDTRRTPTVVSEDHYCTSPDRFYCTVVGRSGHKTVLKLVDIGRSFEYKLCVVRTGVNINRTCKDFETKRRERGSFASEVVLQQAFSTQHNASYLATWSISGKRLGPPLRFVTP